MNHTTTVDRLLKRLNGWSHSPMALFIDPHGNSTINKVGTAICDINIKKLAKDLIGVYTDASSRQQIFDDIKAAGR